MDSYQGNATLLVGDTEIPVTAELEADRSGPFDDWGGRVRTSDSDEDFYLAMDSDEVKIRLEDGREGTVVPTGTSVGSGVLTVSGSGPIPFD